MFVMSREALVKKKLGVAFSTKLLVLCCFYDSTTALRRTEKGSRVVLPTTNENSLEHTVQDSRC